MAKLLQFLAKATVHIFGLRPEPYRKFWTHSATMASSIQQQLTADSFLYVRQQQLTAHSFLYIRPSIPASRQLLEPTVPGYHPLPPARSLPARRATLPTVSMPQPRIAKATRRAPGSQTRTPAQRAARQRSSHQRLAAVNGIASPSKVPHGQRPWAPPPPKKKTNSVYPCARCAHRCSSSKNVRSHFPACVKRNGNPDGLKWNDAINGVVKAPM